jgi:hypothetical protein
MNKHLHVQSKKSAKSVANDLFASLNNNRIKNITFIINNKNRYVAKRKDGKITVTKVIKSGKIRKIRGASGPNAIYKLRDWIDANKLEWYGINEYPEAIDYLTLHPDKIYLKSLLANPDRRAIELSSKHHKLFKQVYIDNVVLDKENDLVDIDKYLISLYKSGNQDAVKILHKIIINNILILSNAELCELIGTIVHFGSHDKLLSVKFLADCIDKYYNVLRNNAYDRSNMTYITNQLFKEPYAKNRNISPILKVLIKRNYVTPYFNLYDYIVEDKHMLNYISVSKNNVLNIDENGLNDVMSKFRNKIEYIVHLCKNENDKAILLLQTIIYDIFEDNKFVFLQELLENRNPKVYSIIIRLLDKRLLTWDYIISSAKVRFKYEWFPLYQVQDSNDYHKFLEKFEKENDLIISTNKAFYIDLIEDLIIHKILKNIDFINTKIRDFIPYARYCQEDKLDKRFVDLHFVWDFLSSCPHPNAFKLIKKYQDNIIWSSLVLNSNVDVMQFLENHQDKIKIWRIYSLLSENPNIFELASKQEARIYNKEYEILADEQRLHPDNISDFVGEFSEYVSKFKDFKDLNKSRTVSHSMLPKKEYDRKMLLPDSKQYSFSSPYSRLDSPASVNYKEPLLRSHSPKSASPKSASPKSASPKSASPKSASPKSASPKSASPKSASPKSASPI